MMHFLQILTYARALTEDQLNNAKIGDVINWLDTWGVGIATGLATLMIIYAGYIYMASQGNQDSQKTAKELIIAALSGLALVILAKLILVDIVGINYQTNLPTIN